MSALELSDLASISRAVYRAAETRHRAAGRFELANAWRMMCDAFEDPIARAHDCSYFDRGVFDLYGPPDVDESPYLLEESPRLNGAVEVSVRKRLPVSAPDPKRGRS